MTLIVGLYSPYPRSGKSTFAQELVSLREDAGILKFADGFRKIVVGVVADFFDGGEAEALQWLEDDRKDTTDIPGLGVTLRHCMQTLGSQWGRALIHPDLWVKLAQQRLRKRNTGVVVVDDLRFENEYHMLKKLGAWFVRLDRPNGPETPRHESNARLDGLPFHYHIRNSGDMADLRQSAHAVARDLGIIR